MKTKINSLAITCAAALIALGALACFAPHHRAELRDALHREVQDPERRRKLLEIIDRRELDRAEFARAQEVFHTEIRRLNSERSTQRAVLERTVAEHDDVWAAHRLRMAAAATEMRALTTPEEWAEISGPDLELLLAPPVATDN